jgi:hypothetical protein
MTAHQYLDLNSFAKTKYVIFPKYHQLLDNVLAICNKATVTYTNVNSFMCCIVSSDQINLYSSHPWIESVCLLRLILTCRDLTCVSNCVYRSVEFK